MKRAFLLVALVGLGCSSGNFEVGTTTSPSGSDTGTSGGGDTSVSIPSDSGSTTPGDEDAGNPSTTPDAYRDGGNALEASVVEASVPIDAGPPPCTKTIPTLTCPGASYEPHFDVAPGTGYLAPSISHGTRHVLTFVTQKKGRIEKIGFRLRRNDLGTGDAGEFTVSAFLMPCPETLVPIGKHTKAAGEVPYDTTFYFTPESTGGLVPHLPYVPAGTRIAFVIETTSTRYTWDLRRSPIPTPNPLSFQWATRSGDGAWSPPSGDAMPSAYTYIRTCDGSS